MKQDTVEESGFFFETSLDDICVMLLLLMMYPQKFRSDNVERNCNFEDIPTEILKEELNAVFCNTITRRSHKKVSSMEYGFSNFRVSSGQRDSLFNKIPRDGTI